MSKTPQRIPGILTRLLKFLQLLRNGNLKEWREEREKESETEEEREWEQERVRKKEGCVRERGRR